MSLLPLLGGNVQVNSIDLEEPSVELIRDGKGVWNFASLARGAQAESKPAETPPEAKSTSSFSLDRLSIRGGKIAMTDHLKNQPRMVYEPIDISLLDYADGKPFSFDISAHFPVRAHRKSALKAQAALCRKRARGNAPSRNALSDKHRHCRTS